MMFDDETLRLARIIESEPDNIEYSPAERILSRAILAAQEAEGDDAVHPALDLLAGTHNQKDRAQAMAAILKGERLAGLKRAEEICREQSARYSQSGLECAAARGALSYAEDAIRKEIDREAS